MFKISQCALLAFLVILTIQTQAADTPSEVILKNLNGMPVTLSEHIGKHPVVLHFWASWCTTCTKKMGELQELKRLAPRETVFFAIHVGDHRQSLKKFIPKGGIDFEVLIDAHASLTESKNVTSIPYTIIYNSRGNVISSGPTLPSVWPKNN